MELLVQVMVQTPAFTPVICPLLRTVAMEVSEEDQVTVLSLASAGSTWAFACAFRPTVTGISAWVILMEVTGCVTVIRTEPVAFEPSAAVATMVAVPFFTPVTMPPSSTVAMAGFLELQVTSVMEALSGAQTASTSIREPAATFLSPASMVIFLTGWMTITRKVSVTSGFWALCTMRSHSPRCTAFRLVPEIRATPASVVVYVIFLLEASSGVQVVDSCTAAPAGSTSTWFAVGVFSREATVVWSGS